jgi:hypothetical protein
MTYVIYRRRHGTCFLTEQEAIMGRVVAVVLVLAALAVFARLDRGGQVELGHVEGHVFGLELRVELTFTPARNARSATIALAAPAAAACALPDSLWEARP